MEPSGGAIFSQKGKVMQRLRVQTFHPAITAVLLTGAMLQAVGPASASVLTLNDNSTHDLNSAVAAHDVEVLDTTTVNLLTGGSISNDLEAWDNSTVTVSGGLIGDDLEAWDNSTLTISGGLIGDDLEARDNSTVTVSGGTIDDDLVAGDNSTAIVTGGWFDDDLEANDNSMVTVSGGTWADDLTTRDNSTVTIFGGTWADDLNARDDSTVTISGGTFHDELITANDSTLTIFGTEFNFAYGDYFDDDSLDRKTLTGILADGTEFSNKVKIGGSSRVRLAAPATAAAANAVPEPSSIAMFGIGALGLLGYSRRRRETSSAA